MGKGMRVTERDKLVLRTLKTCYRPGEVVSCSAVARHIGMRSGAVSTYLTKLQKLGLWEWKRPGDLLDKPKKKRSKAQAAKPRPRVLLDESRRMVSEYRRLYPKLWSILRRSSHAS